MCHGSSAACYRSLLQKSPIKETIFCNLINPTFCSHPIISSTWSVVCATRQWVISHTRMSHMTHRRNPPLCHSLLSSMSHLYVILSSMSFSPLFYVTSLCHSLRLLSSMSHDAYKESRLLYVILSFPQCHIIMSFSPLLMSHDAYKESSSMRIEGIASPLCHSLLSSMSHLYVILSFPQVTWRIEGILFSVILSISSMSHLLSQTMRRTQCVTKYVLQTQCVTNYVLQTQYEESRDTYE